MRIELFRYDYIPGFFVKCFIAEAKKSKIKNIQIFTN